MALLTNLRLNTSANSSILIQDISNPYPDASAHEGSGLGSQTHIVSYDNLGLAVTQCMEGGTVVGVDTSTTTLAVSTTQTASTVLSSANVTSVITTFSN